MGLAMVVAGNVIPFTAPTGAATWTEGFNDSSARTNGSIGGVWTNNENEANVPIVTAYPRTASSYTLTGPSTDTISSVSGPYTVTPDGVYTGTITPSDDGAGGTFTPSSLVFANSSSPQTFTYTPASTGTLSISTTSSPSITDPGNLTLNVGSSPAGQIAVTNTDLVWSPYNWQFNGSSCAQTNPGGAYVKLAFSGSTLGINIDQSMLNGILPTLMVLDAYVDGSTTPLTQTFADATNGGTQITFTTSLSGGNHYATIYFSQSPVGVDRWIGPADDLRVTSLQLATDGRGRILSPLGTPVARKPEKVIFFGDSITEGSRDTSDEVAYSADVAKILGNVEYGQIAYAGAGWDISAVYNVPDFYVNPPNQSTSFWENYNATGSRLVDPSDLSAGFIGGAPDAVYVNMGINDALQGAPATDLETKMSAWLSDIRTTIGARPEIFVIVPFNLGSGDYPTYKADLLAGVSNYETTNPADTRVDVIDLGASAWNIVQENSADGLHPDDAGAMLLAQQIAADSAPLISGVLQPGSITSTSSPTATTISVSTTAPTYGIAPYTYQWYRSTTPGFTPSAATLVTGATSPTLNDTNLMPDTPYYYDVIYGDSTHPDQSVTSSQFSATTSPSPVTGVSGASSGAGASGAGTSAAAPGTATSVTTTTTSIPSSPSVLLPPTISNLPRVAHVGGSFTAEVSNSGNESTSVQSLTPNICRVQGARDVEFLKAGTCKLTSAVGASVESAGATGTPQSIEVALRTQHPIVLTSVRGRVGANLTLDASGGSGTSTINYALISRGTALCTIIGRSTLRAVRQGTCTVVGSENGNATFRRVSSVPTVVTFT